MASQRIEVYLAEWFENEMLKEYLSADVTTKRGSLPTLIEWCILAWVAGTDVFVAQVWSLTQFNSSFLKSRVVSKILESLVF